MQKPDSAAMPATSITNEISRRRFLQRVLAGGLANLTNAFADWGDTDAAVAGNPMAQGRPSTTAQGAAILRAAHQVLDDPRVLDDPIALRIIGEASQTLLLSEPERFQNSRSLRAFIALRSRYAEDELVNAMRRGVRQYVILGAGLDTFSYRNTLSNVSSQLRVFEVDHPATQSWKRQRLSEAGIAIPDALTFAPVDFETQTLAQGLNQAGFNSKEPAFFSLLGVAIYLTKPALMSTLKYVTSLQAGSEIVFDYSVPSSALSDGQRLAREYAAKSVAARGEPWISYFDPSELKRDLLQLGFTHVDDLSPQQANDRYFKDRADNLRVGTGRLMRARI